MPFPTRTTPEHRARLRRFLINTPPARHLSMKADAFEPTEVVGWLNSVLALVPNGDRLQIPTASLGPVELRARITATVDLLRGLFGDAPTDADIEDGLDVLVEGEDSTRALSLPLRNRPAQQRKEAFERTLRARAFAGK